MRSPLRHAVGLALVALVAASPALADELETLRAENARLREQMERLERENAALRGAAAEAPPVAPPRIAEKTSPEGATLWATEPMRVEVTDGSRAAHWVWLVRDPRRTDATLWVRSEFSGGIYRSVDHLELRIDGAGHSLPVVTYDPERVTTGIGQRRIRRDHEVVGAEVAPPVLAALARAGAVTGRLGRVSFVLPSDVVAALRALARRAATDDPPAPTAP